MPCESWQLPLKPSKCSSGRRTLQDCTYQEVEWGGGGQPFPLWEWLGEPIRVYNGGKLQNLHRTCQILAQHRAWSLESALRFILLL